MYNASQLYGNYDIITINKKCTIITSQMFNFMGFIKYMQY